VYDLAANASFNQITVSQTGCKQRAFPVTNGTAGFTYTGNVKLEPFMPSGKPQVISSIILFLQ
jgi:hypothetical protein